MLQVFKNQCVCVCVFLYMRYRSRIHVEPVSSFHASQGYNLSCVSHPSYSPAWSTCWVTQDKGYWVDRSVGVLLVGGEYRPLDWPGAVCRPEIGSKLLSHTTHDDVDDREKAIREAVEEAESRAARVLRAALSQLRHEKDQERQRSLEKQKLVSRWSVD